MSRQGSLGFSNVYLKIGGLLIVASLIVLASKQFFPSLASSANFAFAYMLLSGIILYIIGRVVKIYRSRSKA